MNRNAIETMMGAVVLVVAAVFLIFAYRSSDIGAVKGYELIGQFSQVNGLKSGADVRIGGVKIGTVTGQTLDPKTYLAVVHMSIDPSFQLPRDTMATVASESLLGGKYVSLLPGGDLDYLKPGEKFEYTQAAPDLESLIGQAIFSTNKKDEPKPDQNTPAAP